MKQFCAFRNEIVYLQQRNRDLVAQVEHYTRLNEHLTRQLNDTVRTAVYVICCFNMFSFQASGLASYVVLQRSQVQRLQLNLESDRTGFDEKLKHELGSLREQLQVKESFVFNISAFYMFAGRIYRKLLN